MTQNKDEVDLYRVTLPSPDAFPLRIFKFSISCPSSPLRRPRLLASDLPRRHGLGRESRARPGGRGAGVSHLLRGAPRSVGGSRLRTRLLSSLYHRMVVSSAHVPGRPTNRAGQPAQGSTKNSQKSTRKVRKNISFLPYSYF